MAKKIGSIASERLRYRLWIGYCLMSIVPILFFLYIIFSYLFPPNSDINMEALYVFTFGTIVTLVASLLGLFLLYIPIKGIEKIKKDTDKILGRVRGSEDLEAGEDEVSALQNSFADMISDLQERMSELNAYASNMTFVNQKLNELAVRDDLTNLYNRRYLMERLDEEMLRSQRFSHPLTLIMLDLDNFKDYNDSNGHLAGDEALKTVASLIKKSIREIDIPVRYGGDEFMVILPETGLTQGKEIAERIRNNIPSNPFLYKELSIERNVTVSIGVASYPIHASKILDLIEVVDKYMYKAKNQGGNRVEGSPDRLDK